MCYVSSRKYPHHWLLISLDSYCSILRDMSNPLFSNLFEGIAVVKVD